MEQRQNRRSYTDGIVRMLGRCDFRLLQLLYELLKYFLDGE